MNRLSDFDIERVPVTSKGIDQINHPAHYNTGKIEVIDYIVDKLTKDQFEGYCVGNAMKYVSRYQHKGGMNDLKKAVWYLNKLIVSQNNSND